jgi:hypothetical protein
VGHDSLSDPVADRRATKKIKNEDGEPEEWKRNDPDESDD